MVLTLMPSLVSCCMAVIPAEVAGTLIRRLGWLSRSHNARACFTVFAVSWAKPGSTSIETRPSIPPEDSHIGRSFLQASSTSLQIRENVASEALSPAAAHCAIVAS